MFFVKRFASDKQPYNKASEAFSVYQLVVLVFDNVPQVQAYASYKYPVGFLFGLTSNVSIPIILKMFAEQLQSKLKSASKGK